MASADGAPLRVEVVYCPAAGRADCSEVRLAAGATLQHALQASGLLDRYPELLVRHDLRTGIWGRIRPPSEKLRDGDRVEVYRPLQVDPKESRRLRYRDQQATRRRRA